MKSRNERDTIVTSVSKVGRKEGKAEACLVVIYGLNLGKRYNLAAKTTVIGRGDEAQIVIDQDSVSRKHAKIVTAAGKATLKDLDSTNGTYVNDELIETCELRDGDYVKVGRTIFKYLSGRNIEAEYHEEIYRLTTTDGLTRAYNKRFLFEALERELNRCERYQRYLSLCLFDIDKFKDINDAHGHLAGDDILRQLADLVARNIRREDLLARYGGEEFAIVLPEVDAAGAQLFAEKVRALVAAQRFCFEADSIPVTISLGVTTMFGRRVPYTELIRQADEALYAAKRAGRNRVMVATDSGE